MIFRKLFNKYVICCVTRYICCVEFPFHVFVSSSSSLSFLSLETFPSCLTPLAALLSVFPLLLVSPWGGPVLKKDMMSAYSTVKGVIRSVRMDMSPPAGRTLPPPPPPTGRTSTVEEGAISSSFRLVVFTSLSRLRLGKVVESANPPVKPVTNSVSTHSYTVDSGEEAGNW